MKLRFGVMISIRNGVFLRYRNLLFLLEKTTRDFLCMQKLSGDFTFYDETKT